MILLSDSNNVVVGSYIDGTTVTNLAGVTTLPANTLEQQDGVNAELIIDPTTNTLSYKYIAIGSTLAEVQSNKIAQAQFLYHQALNGGFNSSASGASANYDYSSSSQTKFLKLLASMNAGIITYPYTVPAKDGNPTNFATQTALNELFKDISAFEQLLENKLTNYITQINACTTIAQVNAFNISYQ